MAIEIHGEKRNLNMNINAQQAILNAYILNNSRLYKDYICQGFISDSDFTISYKILISFQSHPQRYEKLDSY